MPVDIANTILNASPYFDDYSEDKNFYRVLFRPTVAVQARELNQIQSIAQNQIERFGNHIFKDGSIIKGCGIAYLPSIDFVCINDQFQTNTSLSSTNTQFVNAIAVGNTSGVVAQIIAAREGFKASSTPAKFFVRYTQPGTNNERTFIEGEPLNIYTPGKSYIDKVVLQVNTATTVNTTNFPVGSKIVNETSRARGFVSNAYSNSSGNYLELRNVRKTFFNNDVVVLSIDTSITSTVLDVDYITFANSFVDSVNVLPSNAALYGNSLGFAYGVAVSPGIVFHKGHFIKVDSHTTLVNEDGPNPAGKLLYFNTTEQVIKETDDSSLFDNASGTTNINAPGAHRLKLSTTLVARDKVGTNSVSNTEVAFPIVEFGNSGPIFQKTNTEYSIIGDEFAKRTFEESGHYIIKPFSLITKPSDTSVNNFNYEVSQGLAYVRGKRREFSSNQDVASRRGIDTISESEKLTSITYGNYTLIKEVSGYFPIDQSIEVQLYNSTQTAITNERMPGEAATGTLVGRANIRAIKFIDDGTNKKGSPSAQYRLYLFNYRPVATYTFQDARSVVYNDGSSDLAFADLVLNTSSVPSILEANGTPLFFSLNAKAVKNLQDEDGNNDSNYYYTGANTSANIAITNGAITFTMGSQKGVLGFSDTSDLSESLVDVIVKDANASTVALTGTVAASATNVITGTSTTFTSDFLVGECIQFIGAAITSRITAIASNTSMTVNNAVTAVANTYRRVHVRGSHIPLNPATGSKRTLTINSNTSATINMGVDYTGVANVVVRFKAYNNDSTQLSKNISRDNVVIIRTSNNVGGNSGPWSLGVPDVLRLKSVFLGTNTTNFVTSQNKVDNFVLNNGQQDAFYDHASITLSPTASIGSLANNFLLVQFDCFTVNAVAGEGLFSVESYPVNDAINANAATSIRTAEIPIYSQTSGNTVINYDLRDVVDFRPYKANTANVTQSITLATINPAITNTFNSNTTSFNPYPASDFISNLTYYLGRKDRLTLNSDGIFNVNEGLPGIAPRLPAATPDVITIAEVTIPPYPSLTDLEKQTVTRSDYNITYDVLTHKRFTMKDISILEKRIERLEYYTTLNTLELIALQTSIPDSSGNARFQNGFFVDPFNSHIFGRTDDLDYKIAIDEKNGVLRPAFIPEVVDMEFDTNPTSYNNVEITGGMVSLPYTEESYVEQLFASDPVNVSGVPIRWAGIIDIRPKVYNGIEYLAPPVSVGSSSRVAQSYDTMISVTPGTANYGWWREEIQTSDDFDINKSTNDTRSSTSVAVQSNIQVAGEDGQKATSGIVYLSKEKVYGFRAVGLKPNTIHYLFINGNDNSSLAALGELNTDSTSPDEAFVLRTSPWNTPLESDSSGEIIGKFITPANGLTSGTHKVSLRNRKTISSGVDESFAEGFFSISIDLQNPPQSPQPNTQATPAKSPLAAKFGVSGNTTITSTANSTGFASNGLFTLTFTDDSYISNGSIAAYEWNFGAVNNFIICSSNTQSSVGPHTITFKTINSIQDVVVTLKVSDSSSPAITSETSELITLRKLPAVIDGGNTEPNVSGVPSCTLTLVPTLSDEVTDIADYTRWGYLNVDPSLGNIGIGYPFFGFVYDTVVAATTPAVLKINAKPSKDYEANVQWTVTTLSGPPITQFTGANVTTVFVSSGGSGYSNTDTIRFSNGQVDGFATLFTNTTGGIVKVSITARGNFSNGTPVTTELFTANSTLFNNLPLTGSGHTNTSIQVAVNGLIQGAGTDYSVSGGTTLVFTTNLDFSVSPDVVSVQYGISGAPGSAFIDVNNIRVQISNTTNPANSTNGNTSAGTGASLTILRGDTTNLVSTRLTNDLLTIRSNASNNTPTEVMVKADMYLANGYANSIANVSQVFRVQTTTNVNDYRAPLPGRQGQAGGGGGMSRSGGRDQVNLIKHK